MDDGGGGEVLTVCDGTDENGEMSVKWGGRFMSWDGGGGPELILSLYDDDRSFFSAKSHKASRAFVY